MTRQKLKNTVGKSSVGAVADVPAFHESSAESVGRHISAVYALGQNSSHVFASPLGPFSFSGRQAYLPRFVFFGPHASEECWRLALLSGFDWRDSRAIHALLALVEHLAADAEAAHGLNLAIFPVVDAAGLYLGANDRSLSARHWGHETTPELDLLEKDARLRGYHGFVRMETSSSADEVASIRVNGAVVDPLSPDLELITTADLSVAPFELTLQLPAAWSHEFYQRAAVGLLRRFLWQYRAFQAYGLHL